MSLIRFSSFLVASLLLSCGARTMDETATSSSAGGEKPTTKSEFLGLFVTKLCAFGDECGTSDLLYGGHCVEVLGDGFQSSSIVTHAEVHFDANAGALCLQALDDFECSTDLERLFGQTSAFSKTCAPVFYGDADVDGACSINEQCKVGLQCDKSVSCPGTCQPTPKLGEPCVQMGPECADDLDCFEGACTPLGQAGDACGADYPDCSRITVCDYNLSAPTCMGYTVAEPGAPCTSACTQGYICAAPTASEPKVCRPVGKLGGACSNYSDCEAGAHCSELFEAGVCEKDVVLGEACDPEETIPCGVGLCLNGVCAFPKSPGQPCQLAEECNSDSCVEGKCAVEPDCPGDAAQ